MFYLAIVSLIWAFSFGIIGSSLTSLDSFFVATLRLASASLIFLPFLRPSVISSTDSLRLFIYGFIQFGLMYISYIKAYQYLPSHLVALFSIFTPLYVVIINDIRKGQFSSRYLIAALLSVCGAAIIKVQNLPTSDFWLGFALMQIAGVAFAFGQIAYRDWKCSHPSVSDLSIFALLTLGGSLCAGLFSLAFSDRTALVLSISQWQSILYLGLVSSGVGFFLWNKGATLTNPGILAAFNNAVVPLAMLFSLFIFGEINQVTKEQIIRLLAGGLFVITAVTFATKCTKRTS
ncbi:EamA family transporter [Opitutae bacterium]|nr:EamA family transporter [Opitutae bacterium]